MFNNKQAVGRATAKQRELGTLKACLPHCDSNYAAEAPLCQGNDGMNLVERYIASRKAERGLTAKGERWLRQTLPKFAAFVQAKGMPLLNVDRETIRQYLSSVNGSAWNRHSYFRAIRALCNWLEREGYLEASPCHGLEAPKLPRKVMPRPTMQQIAQLLESVSSPRDKAILCLFIDTGFRLCELANIKLDDVDWQARTVRVWGKGAKQRVGKFSYVTERHLSEHLRSFSPNGNIWGLTADGIACMLKRLRKRTGIVCNPHSLRRAWAIEAIKRGTNLLDVQTLGGWTSLEMVRTYAQEANLEDVVNRYQPVTEVLNVRC
jgi:site-specific recombinase XerD